MSDRTSRGFFSSPPSITTAQKAALKRHVVNMNFGKFSTGGDFQTTQQNVKAIFEQHLPAWVANQPSSKDRVDVVFYAHGGLTNEGWGLATAAKQMDWWLSNGVYPIFFVWETGAMETLWQLFRGSESRMPPSGARGLGDLWDGFRDNMWERTVRTIGGPRVWAGMKTSAKNSFDDDFQGDGNKVLEFAYNFIEDSERRVRLHAVGHSAGSIFLTHAIAAANEYVNYPVFESVHFLAPAITTDLFRNQLLPLIENDEGRQAKRLTVYTMDDSLERDDNVGPYKKSLLYLIYHALEPEKETDLLGLERSLNSEPDMARFFGLAGASSKRGEVIYSKTGSSGPSNRQSNSTTHGGFDDDPSTMESVCRRILGIKNNQDIVSFPANRGGSFQLPSFEPFSNQPAENFTATHSQTTSARQGTGRDLALCIGINDYPTAPLSGCENDARRWEEWLSQNGFSVELLMSQQATRANIVNKIRDLFGNSQAGDRIVIQYAGHGTTVPDDNGDEAGGDTPGHDEALVPVDYMNDGLLLDDDLGDLCRTIPEGVNVTLFMDCCHSGTNTRMFMRAAANSGQGRSRFLRSTPAMIDANRRARAQRGGARFSGNPYTGNREILFAACRSGEPAWESGGSGDFTRHAMSVLRQHGSQLSCLEFMNRVKAAFGANARQTPGLWCDPRLENQMLLAGGNGGDGGRIGTDDTFADGDDPRNALLEIQRVLNRYL